VTQLQTPNREQAFAAFLERLNKEQDRGALAALRRGLGKPPGQAADMHRYIVPWLSASAATPYVTWREEVYYLVASLFALYPESTWPPGQGPGYQRNLGASFAQLEQASDQGRQEDGKQTSSVERRFVALLNSNSEDLHTHLRHATGLLKAKDIPVNWAVLLGDLLWWDSDSRRVQRQWARAFWGRIPSTEATQDDVVDAAIETESDDATDADQ
jgi:CRISPR type I-E-associated protein CasB/Cse2